MQGSTKNEGGAMFLNLKNTKKKREINNVQKAMKNNVTSHLTSPNKSTVNKSDAKNRLYLTTMTFRSEIFYGMTWRL